MYAYYYQYTNIHDILLGYWDAGARRLAEEAVDSRLGSWAILRSANFEDSVDGDLRRGMGGTDAGGGKLDVDCPQSAGVLCVRARVKYI